MRSAAPLVLALILLLAGCLSQQATPAAVAPAKVVAGVDAEGFAPVLFDKARFEEKDLGVTSDGLRLHGDVYLPDHPTGAAAPTKFPAILLLSPYWGGGTQGKPIGYMPYDFLVQRLLPRGYAVVFGDLGGNGGSSGCWDFMGPVERRSAVAMVEAVASQPWSDGKVGMMGLSYDAMTQIMAASDKAPHLVTVVPASGLTEAYKGLKTNGVGYAGGWHTTISSYESSSLQGPGANPSRLQGWTETVASSPACLVDNHLGDAPTGAYTDYYKARDFRALGANVTASVFVTQGFFDPAVKPDNFGAWFQNVPTLKKAWLGFWYHQYPIAANAGRDDMYLTLHRWLDHELKDIDNGIDKEPAIDVQDSQGRWRHEAAWPPADAAPAVFAADGKGALVADAASAGPGALPFGGPQGATALALQDGGGTLRLKSAPLAAPIHVAGAPRLNLSFTPHAPQATVIARLYDNDRMVSQGAFNLLFAGGLDAPAPLTPGQAVRASFALYPTDWVVEAGHALTLELSTVDGQLWFDSDAPLQPVDLDAGPTSTITLPTIARGADAPFLVSCGASLKAAVQDCWKDLKDKGVKTG